MNTKYLSDGRKVAVIGQLNNIESIVHEIFVTAEGDELPSGERFVVKSLHDAPVESWKVKSEREIQAKISKAESEYESKKFMIEKVENELKLVRDLLVASKQIVSAFGEKEAKRVADFITGNIEYVLEDGYGEFTCKKFKEVLKSNEGYSRNHYDGIKLVSLFGRSEGDLGYRIHQYRDGSGGWDHIYPCATKKDAQKKVKEFALEKLNAGRLYEKYFKACIDFGVKFTKEELKKYYSDLIVSMQAMKSEREKNLNKAAADFESMKESEQEYLKALGEL